MRTGLRSDGRVQVVSGLAAGDPVALVCGNRLEFAVVRFAAHRAGDRDKSRWDLTTAQERAQLAVLKYLKRQR